MMQLVEPTGIEFERAVAGSKPDVDRLLVYADSLTSRGDPLGELIVTQVSNHEANPLLELELTTKIRQRLGLGSRELQALAMEWRWGFVDTLTLKGVKGVDHAKFLSQVLAAPACRFVRHLKIQLAHLSGAEARDASWLADVEELAKLELLKRLACGGSIKKFGPIAARVPRLEHLTLGTSALPARKHLALPLKSLELLGFGPGVDALLAKPPWTELTHLKIEQEVDSVNEVLASCPLASADLYGSQALMRNLVSSPHVAKLQKLTLRKVSGVRPLVEGRAALQHLTLHLIDGGATREDVGTLKASVKQLSFAGLLGPPGPDGYSLPIRL